MSRSYKKHPWVCDRNPFMKNYANRRLRRIAPEYDIIAGGNWYQKYSCSWNICDFKSNEGQTFHEYIRESEKFLHRKLSKSERNEAWIEWQRLRSK